MVQHTTCLSGSITFLLFLFPVSSRDLGSFSANTYLSSTRTRGSQISFLSGRRLSYPDYVLPTLEFRNWSCQCVAIWLRTMSRAVSHSCSESPVHTVDSRLTSIRHRIGLIYSLSSEQAILKKPHQKNAIYKLST
jgi:hypothetical protein